MASYFSFYRQAITRYQVHSPQVFTLIEDVLEDKRHYYSFDEIERYRERLINYPRQLHSGVTKELVKPQLPYSIAPTTGQQLFKTLQLFPTAPKVDWGTRLGISSLYMEAADRRTPVAAVPHPDGSPALLQKIIDKKNIHLVEPNQLDVSGGIFFINEVIDLQKTFETILPKKPFLVIVKAPWRQAKSWQHCLASKHITLSIDTWKLGWLFFEKDRKEKEHFGLVPTWKKPWRAIF